MDKKRTLSEAKKKANAKFNAVAYDRLEMKIPKGKKELIRLHAEQYQPEVGEIGREGYTPKGSMTGFISRAIDETMIRDATETESANKPNNKNATIIKVETKTDISNPITLTFEQVAAVTPSWESWMGTNSERYAEAVYKWQNESPEALQRMVEGYRKWNKS